MGRGEMTAGVPERSADTSKEVTEGELEEAEAESQRTANLS